MTWIGVDELKQLVWVMNVKKYYGDMKNKKTSLDYILYRIQRVPHAGKSLFHTKYISFMSSTT